MPGGIVGEARAVHAATIAGSAGGTTVVLLRLEQYDPTRGRVSSLPVRLMGDEALGFASDGDILEVTGKKRYGELRATRAINRSTGATYAANTRRKVVIVLAALLAFLIVTTLIFTIVAQQSAPTYEPPLTPTIAITPSSGPAGTTIEVSGTGFRSGEGVTVRFHATDCAEASADADGAFAGVTCVVPDNYASFAGQDFQLVGEGRSSLAVDTATFGVTG